MAAVVATNKQPGRGQGRALVRWLRGPPGVYIVVTATENVNVVHSSSAGIDIFKQWPLVTGATLTLTKPATHCEGHTMEMMNLTDDKLMS